MHVVVHTSTALPWFVEKRSKSLGATLDLKNALEEEAVIVLAGHMQPTSLSIVREPNQIALLLRSTRPDRTYRMDCAIGKVPCKEFLNRYDRHIRVGSAAKTKCPKLSICLIYVCVTHRQYKPKEGCTLARVEHFAPILLRLFFSPMYFEKPISSQIHFGY
jgi:hypothetical protein